MGPVMIDIKGTQLDQDEITLISNKLVGGVILFSRNFLNKKQLKELIAHCRSINDALIVAVDHEGGRVQRFRDTFTAIPAMSKLGELFDNSPYQALNLAYHTAIVLAYELRELGINLSFTPVLDLNFGRSEVIGDRSFHSLPQSVTALTQCFIDGLHACGFPSVGKHFPGHGYVNADSHLTLPYDDRSLADIQNHDLIPYRLLINSRLDAVMPAHVVYSAIDSQPAGFSKVWLQDILRNELKFDGVIFSDDLSMEGAVQSGTPEERARLAFNAGCDMVLICNHPADAQQLVTELSQNYTPSSASINRLRNMMTKGHHATVNEDEYQASLKFLSNWN